MSIITLKKVTLIGEKNTQSQVMSELQSLGCMHLIEINPHKSTKLMNVSTTSYQLAKKALLLLKNTPEKAKPKSNTANWNAEKLIAAVLDNENELRTQMDKHDLLLKQVNRLAVLGDFNLLDKDELHHHLFWFYKIKNKDVTSLPHDFAWQEICRDQQYIYIVVISPEEPPPSAFPTPRLHTGSIPLHLLQKELQATSQKIDDLHEERRALTRYQWLLNECLANYADETMLQNESQKIRIDKDFYIIQGWVPETEIERLKKFAKQFHLALSIESISPTEQAPTLLASYPWAKGGVDIVNFYQLPGYHALDPSLSVFFSFSLFFAMILADAGYGFIIALFTLCSWKWLNKFKSGQGLKYLLLTISLFSIMYGVIVGSYFGIEPKAGNVLHQFVLLHMNNINDMMMVSVLVGCIHVMLANAMRFWFSNHLEVKFESLGFVFLIGGIILLTYALLKHHVLVRNIAIVIMTLSLLTIMIFSSNIPVTNFKSFLKRSFKGLLSLSEIIALFSDILSYLRLFALGLAGASLAITINHITVSLAKSSSYGWIFGLLVFLLGQTLNFTLCVMSAIIHGLRLNYIEFYKWSIKEEGYAYEPLKKTEATHE